MMRNEARHLMVDEDCKCPFEDNPLPIPEPKDRETWVAKWHGVDYVSFNTHVGMGIRNGGLEWIIQTWKPDIILCQEVKNVSFASWIGEWWVVWYGHNAILARKSAFNLLEHGGPDIRFGSPWVRNQVFAVLEHHMSRRIFYVQDVHLDPLHGQPDISKVRDQTRLRRHMTQGNAYIDWQKTRMFDRAAINVDGGDYNELVYNDHLIPKPGFLQMTMAYKYGLLKMYRASKLTARNSGPIRIDDLFFRERWFLKVIRRQSVNLRKEFKGIDHNTIRVRTQVRERRRLSLAARKLVRR